MTFYFYLIVAALLGGIPIGLVVGYAAGHGNIRNQGSGNIGATNVWRVAGPGAGIATLIGDVGKGVVAVLLCRTFFDTSWPVAISTAALLGGTAAVLGHMFSPFLLFRGGKGVNTALGVFISLMPVETVIACGVFIIMVAATRLVSLGSIVAALALAAVIWLERFVANKPIDPWHLAAAAVVPILIIVTHRQNIKRLVNGTESRFHFRKTSS